MANMKESVFVMAKWLNLHMMENQYKTAFNKMADSGNLSKTMKDEKWQDLLNRPEPDPDDPAQTDVFMDATEWEKLYKEFLKTFRTMNDNRDSLKDANNKDALKILDLVYGPNNYFYPKKTDQQTSDKIKQLIVFLESASGKNIGEYLLRQIGIEKTNDISDFYDKIKKGKYDSDTDLKNQLERLIRNVKWLISDDNPNQISSNASTNLKAIDYDAILDGLDERNEQIPAAQIDNFKTIFPVLLRPMLTKDKFRDAFSTSGGSKIITQVNKALEKTNYKDTNSNDYVAPSEKDTLTWQQQLKKDWEDFKDDTIAKLKNRAKYDKYLMPNITKPIAVEIYEAGWKPTDGLAKLNDIKSKLDGNFKGKKPECAKALSFLMAALEEAKNKIPKAFEGALKNGKQGLALDIFITEYGLKNGKSDTEISAAHEVLSKLRWGYNTSTKREKLFKEPIVLFSDKNLSWNKNGGEFMEIFSNAADKTINFVFKQTFNLFNAGINAIRRHARYYKLNEKEQNRIDRINADIDEKISDHQRMRNNIEAERNQLRNDRIPHKNMLRTLRNAGFNRAARQQATIDIDASNQLLDQLEQQKERENNNLTGLQNQKDQINNQIQDLQNQIQQLNSQKQVFQFQAHQARQNGDLATEAQALALAQQATQNINNINANIARLNNQLRIINPRINNAMTNIGTLSNQITAETNRIQPTKDKANQYDDAVESLREIKENISGLDSSLQTIDEDINKLDNTEKKRFLNLMATRNMMNGEGGFVKNRKPFSLLFGSQENIQKDFNSEKDRLKQQYIAQYWANQGVSIDA